MNECEGGGDAQDFLVYPKSKWLKMVLILMIYMDEILVSYMQYFLLNFGYKAQHLEINSSNYVRSKYILLAGIKCPFLLLPDPSCPVPSNFISIMGIKQYTQRKTVFLTLSLFCELHRIPTTQF